MLWVANMIGQHGVQPDSEGVPPIRYNAVQLCLSKVAQFALNGNFSVHIPRIGCGLAGGTWEHIGPIVERELALIDIPTTVYDFA